MPNKCCVTNCRGNYDDNSRISVFSFPSDTSLREKWIRAIPRKDFAPTAFTKVCELHFNASDIRRTASFTDEKTGRTVTASIKIPRLQPDAVPCIFPGCPPLLIMPKQELASQAYNSVCPKPTSQPKVIPVITQNNMVSGYIILNPAGKSSTEVKTSSQQCNGISMTENQLPAPPNHIVRKKCSTTLELHQQISTCPSGWIYSYDGSKLAFSKKENNVEKLSVLISENLEATLKVYNQTLNSDHPVLQYLPPKIDSLDSLDTALSIFTVWKVCPGISDERFHHLCESKFNVGHYVKETESFISYGCAILFLPQNSTSKICKNCQTLRKAIHSRDCSKRLSDLLKYKSNSRFSSFKASCSKIKLARARSHAFQKKLKFQKQNVLPQKNNSVHAQKNNSVHGVDFTEVDGDICYLVEVIDSP